MSASATQGGHKKTKGRFDRLLQHLAWKWRWPILVSALHKFVTYLLIYLLTHLPTYSRRTYKGQVQLNL